MSQAGKWLKSRLILAIFPSADKVSDLQIRTKKGMG
jgi:hypothetical protein